MVMNTTLFGNVCPRVFVTIVIFGLFAAYAAEIGSYTIHTDHFYEIQMRRLPYTYWAAYGRYGAELLHHLTGGLYPPTLTLIVGLGALAGTTAILTTHWGISDPFERAVGVLLVSVFPFFFETFSFHALRHVVPIAIGLAVAGIVVRPAYGFILLLAAAMFYQSAVYFAAVVLLVTAAASVLRHDRPWEEAARTLVARIVLIAAALLAWRLVVWSLSGSRWSANLGNFAGTAQSAVELWTALRIHAMAMVSFFTEGVPFFPLYAKLTAAFGILAIAIGMARRRVDYGTALFVLLCVALMPVAAHGANLVLFPPHSSLFQRVLFAYAAVFVGIYSLALLANTGALRRVVTLVFGIVAATFIWQANVWHQFMVLKNMADLDVARQISSSLKAHPEFRPWMPLHIVGTMRPTEYLAFRTFEFRPGFIGNTALMSSFEANWSRDRALMGFMTFLGTNPDQAEVGARIAADMPSWPAPGSVQIRDGVMVVVLGK